MSQDTNIQDLRQFYATRTLNEADINKDPFIQFQEWFEEVIVEDFVEPNAMNIATVNEQGDVSSRVVLLKIFDKKGFVFFTNYKSQKAKDLESTKRAALTFWWDKLHRQVRIQGRVEKISKQESKDYFHSRPRGSQIGAIASNQSEVIESYEVLEGKFKNFEKEFDGREVPYPEHWGGFRVIPNLFEFWQGRPNRLHDRLRYIKDSSGWKIERLSP